MGSPRRISHFHLSIPDVGVNEIIEHLLFISAKKLQFCQPLQILAVELFSFVFTSQIIEADIESVSDVARYF